MTVEERRLKFNYSADFKFNFPWHHGCCLLNTNQIGRRLAPMFDRQSSVFKLDCRYVRFVSKKALATSYPLEIPS